MMNSLKEDFTVDCGALVERFRRSFVAPALASLVPGEFDDRGGSLSYYETVESNIKSVYLAHPFAEKEKVEAEFQPKLEALGIRVINPFQRAEQGIYEAALKTAEGLNAAQSADIVNKDLEKIDEAGALVALMIHDRMLGTIMEIFYSGYMMEYPTFVYAPTERYSKHPWIMHLSTVSTTWDQLEEQLKNWQAR